MLRLPGIYWDFVEALGMKDCSVLWQCLATNISTSLYLLNFSSFRIRRDYYFDCSIFNVIWSILMTLLLFMAFNECLRPSLTSFPIHMTENDKLLCWVSNKPLHHQATLAHWNFEKIMSLKLWSSHVKKNNTSKNDTTCIKKIVL